MTWEQRMAQRHTLREHGAHLDPGPQPPRPDGLCICYEPKIDGTHGWGWFHVAPGLAACPHEHHNDEVWLA